MSGLDATVRAALEALESAWTDGPRVKPPSPFVRAWIDAAVAHVDPDVASRVVRFYGHDVPHAWAQRFHQADPVVQEVVRTDLREAAVPRLRGALQALLEGARLHGVEAAQTWDAATASALLDASPRLLDLHARAFYGASQPMVSLGQPEQASIVADVARGLTVHEVLDGRLAAKLVHELTHGPDRDWSGGPGSWMVQEAVAAAVGLACDPAHIVPERPGEPVLGLNTAMALGHVIRDHWGEAAVWRLALTSGHRADVLGPHVGAAMVAADWQVWLGRLTPSFLPNHSHLVDLARLLEVVLDDVAHVPGLARLADAEAITPALAATLPDLRALARSVPLPSLRLWAEAPAVLDVRRVHEAVCMLFGLQRLQPDVQSVPSDPPGGVVTLVVEDAELQVAQRGDDAHGFAVGARLPLGVCRHLHDRGLRRLTVTGAGHAHRQRLTDRLVDLIDGTRPLPASMEVHVGDAQRLLVPVPHTQLHEPDPVVTVGCCLARDLGQRLATTALTVDVQPLGLRHDPVAVAEGVEALAPTHPADVWLLTMETAWREGTLLTVHEAVERLREALTVLWQQRPHARVVLAVSPVVAPASDPVASRRSKAVLHLVAAALEGDAVQVLPAFEVVEGQMMDARWRQADGAHLTEQASDVLFAAVREAWVAPAARA